jgi:type II secretory pathway pseudopilin PulG
MQRRNRGATLVEALVAMAVMAFGMLAIVGVQQTLRVNADISKQRSEATRLAEVAIEEIRTEAGSGGASFDAMAEASGSKTHHSDNATFTLETTVTKTDDKRRLSAYVLVKWNDRTGVEREVAMHDMVTRVDPVLSGLVGAAKPLTAVGRRKSRHPTIPIDADDLKDGTSLFRPPTAGPIAWLFNNSTGEITHRCVTPEGSVDPKAGCGDPLEHSGQLLAGEVRFNLRGGAKSLGAESVFKPISGGNVAWVINHATKRLVRICPVSALVPTASLTADMVSSGCTMAGALEVPVEPFETTDATHTLTAADSEHPSWPSIPVNVGHVASGSGLSDFGISSIDCFSDANPGSTAHAVMPTTQITVKYFCLIVPNSADGVWWGRIQVVPQRYSDGNDAKWSTGTTEGTYRVCRNTTAKSDFTDNLDHPAEYGKTSESCGLSCPKVTGNLINQNFLIIEGTKSCPPDGPIDLDKGDLVNSNTRQHQP